MKLAMASTSWHTLLSWEVFFVARQAFGLISVLRNTANRRCTSLTLAYAVSSAASSREEEAPIAFARNADAIPEPDL
jgi:hypothetical protein